MKNTEAKNPQTTKHWSEHKEKAGLWHMVLFFLLFKTLPSFLLRLMAYPIGFCYFLFSKNAKAESKRFLQRYAAYASSLQHKSLNPPAEWGTASTEHGLGPMLGGGTSGSKGRKKNTHPREVGKLSALKHMVAFALTVIEKTQAWGGKIPLRRIHFQGEEVATLVAALEKGRGAVLLCSHLGNAELLRALADHQYTGVSREIAVSSVLDNVSPFFSRLLSTLNPRSSLKLIHAQSIGPNSIILLKEEIERGGLAVIAADRTSAQNRNNCFSLPFLGAQAPFPKGPFLLAALLEAPVYAVFALRQKNLSPRPEYNMHVHRLGSIEGIHPASRKERNKTMENWARHYAALLEAHLLENPYQWYNFYDFWG
ncbi:MAG: hypothetical protein FWG75_08680 [Cystobacterineae bacterium]|nr:hypothetical protein [Cystobacterineae bacterium]